MTTPVDGPYCAIHDAAHPPCDPLDAGVISDMDRPVVLSPADADRVDALIEERPGPTEAMRALFAERRPCAGWVATEIGSLVLRRSDGVGSHAVVHGLTWRTANASGSAPTLEAAQLAAEDALRAIAAGDPAGGGVVTLALVIDRFTRAGWSVTIAPGREPWAIRVEAWRMDGTDRVSAGNTTPRELLYAVADPSATISDALVEIAGVLGVDVG